MSVSNDHHGIDPSPLQSVPRDIPQQAGMLKSLVSDKEMPSWKLRQLEKPGRSPGNAAFRLPASLLRAYSAGPSG